MVCQEKSSTGGKTKVADASHAIELGLDACKSVERPSDARFKRY
jgi:hypothetical protein